MLILNSCQFQSILNPSSISVAYPGTHFDTKPGNQTLSEFLSIRESLPSLDPFELKASGTGEAAQSQQKRDRNLAFGWNTSTSPSPSP